MRLFYCSVLLLLAGVVYANVTISPNVAGFADSNGVATNTMNFALVFNTDNSTTSFNPGSYDPFDITSSGQFLTVGGVPTDDWYAFGSEIGETQGGPPPSFLSGFAGTLSGIPYTNLLGGDQFAVIWFESNNALSGSSYGFITDAALITPPDGGNATFDSVLTNDIKVAAFTVVPEPETYAAIFGLIGLGLVMWRRRR